MSSHSDIADGGDLSTQMMNLRSRKFQKAPNGV
ncbi:hypothetical protein FOVG_03709 [Fusarium oxysporum f. sp. pisi HDV247]|uniref:Uncharacterized protein n=1 Tax=Fusarium oxysporum f. sp. pisi HDV247 TaxID=1080344 RepID=W9QIJ6_FUSOX|nr:hypothetical protein FOVG_03709 [Fusarium oxysporum f. sp. pisi HDV247]